MACVENIKSSFQWTDLTVMQQCPAKALKLKEAVYEEGRVTVLRVICPLLQHPFVTEYWYRVAGSFETHFGPDMQVIFHWLYGQITPNTVTRPLLDAVLLVAVQTDRQYAILHLARFTELLPDNDKLTELPWLITSNWLILWSQAQGRFHWSTFSNDRY